MCMSSKPDNVVIIKKDAPKSSNTVATPTKFLYHLMEP
eukprot:UN10561